MAPILSQPQCVNRTNDDLFSNGPSGTNFSDIIKTLKHLHLYIQWRHNEFDSVSNHQPHDYLLNRLFRGRSKKTSKLRLTGEFPAQRASNAENVSIWWCHHENAFGNLVCKMAAIMFELQCVKIGMTSHTKWNALKLKVFRFESIFH